MRSPGLAMHLRDTGHAVDLMHDGTAAESTCAATGPTSSCSMSTCPGSAGWRCCGIRRGAMTAPVLLLTARGRTDEQDRGAGRGADDYLVKPFEMAELAPASARFRAVRLAPWPNRARSAAAFDRPTPGSSDRMGPLDVPRRECRLFERHWCRGDRLASKRGLLDAVYGTGADVEERWSRSTSRACAKGHPFGVGIGVRGAWISVAGDGDPATCRCGPPHVVILAPLLRSRDPLRRPGPTRRAGPRGQRFDRSLLSTALAVSRDVAVSGGDALSRGDRDLLRDTSGGAVFYHVYAPDGVFVTGYATPPVHGRRHPPRPARIWFDGPIGSDVRVLRFIERCNRRAEGRFHRHRLAGHRRAHGFVRDRPGASSGDRLADGRPRADRVVRGPLGLAPLLDLETAIAPAVGGRADADPPPVPPRHAASCDAQRSAGQVAAHAAKDTSSRTPPTSCAIPSRASSPCRRRCIRPGRPKT